MAEFVFFGKFKSRPDLPENEATQNSLAKELLHLLESQPLFKLDAFAVDFKKTTPRKAWVGTEFISAADHVRVEVLPGEIIHKAMLGNILGRVLGEECVDITYLQVEAYLGADRLEAAK